MKREHIVAQGNNFYGSILDLNGKQLCLAGNRHVNLGDFIDLEIYLQPGDPFPLRVRGRSLQSSNLDEHSVFINLDLEPSHHRKPRRSLQVSGALFLSQQRTGKGLSLEPREIAAMKHSQPLVQADQVFPSLLPKTGHKVARTQAPSDYPKRGEVPESWDAIDEKYQPKPYTAQKVLKADWAESADYSLALEVRAKRLGCETGDLESLFPSYETLTFDFGVPKNPRGPTGIMGRGVLGRYGPNFAADPMVFRVQDGFLDMVAIQRRDNHKWAIPGGMVDHDEKVSQTLARELAEEALGLEASPEQAKAWQERFGALFEKEATLVYQGYIDDFRNTDDAYMQTSAYSLFLDAKMAEFLHWDLQLQAGDDAAEARWMRVCERELADMHANHADLVRRAVQIWEKDRPVQVLANGAVNATE